MKTKKLLSKIRAFFDSDLRDVQRQTDSLREVLDKLKKKETVLKSRLENEHDPKARKKLEKKISLVHSQRKKGLDLLKSLHLSDSPERE
ncbi:hypothetical protein [Motiliproteus sp. MSK22-1]|uniref:hypothetical protein n=1 Tax=Motiliproteus sp. MSK22-1 TaxID=1897630 RepID=UPI00097726A3|nr:hypothetical protein [Motiliproteus sp. MSK22-1]OMH30310.1 hypothetical protein BGP75_18155 [Motiliproteus sp. MSK22-1]